MKNILVTGGAGYIGSHTCKALSKAGYKPIVIDNLSTGFEKAVQWGPLIVADIQDKEVVSTILTDHNIDSVIHFAASSQVAESIDNPDKYFTNNVENACLFLKTCIDNGVKNFIFSSTAAVYGNPLTDIITEDHQTKPINPYGDSKLAFETILREEAPKYAGGDFNSIVLRYFNACGADVDGEIGEDHDPETHLIPLICKAWLKGDHIRIFGTDYKTVDGTAVRDYVDVADLADAHVRALESLLGGGSSQVFNVGTGAGYSVLQVCQMASGMMEGLRGENLDRRPGDPRILVASNQKIKDALGWEPKTPLEESIRRTLAWERKKLD
jgi:UDP-glucose 4-epimerase/UDP-arabinose 4-epimerase